MGFSVALRILSPESGLHTIPRFDDRGCKVGGMSLVHVYRGIL